MTKMFDQLAEELFQILKGSGKMLTLYDENGKRVYNPEDTRRIFAEPDKLMLSIDENGSDSEVKLYISQHTDISKLEKLINTIRHLSTRFNVLFNVRKYGRELSPKDFAYQNLPVNENSIFEALTGSTRTSYQMYGTSRLVVRHSARVDEEKRGSRTRNINALFIETNKGERFKFPLVHLSGARAWAQHFNQGGTPFDDIGQHIVETASKSADLAKINKHILHNRSKLGESAFDVRNKIKEKMYEIRCHLGKLARQRGYVREIKNIDFSNTLNENQADIEKCQQLGVLLGITEDNPLATSLMSTILLTKGENMVNSNNPQFHQVVALENADDLIETLQYEYGHKENSAWKRNGSNVVFLIPEAFSDAKSYLDMNNVRHTIKEQGEDKILAYAEKWVKTNSTNMGYQSAEDPDDPGRHPTQWSPKDRAAFEGKAAELAQGIKDLLNGRLNVKPVPAASAGAANPQAAQALKIGQLLAPHAGLQNDMLYNYLSSVHEKLGAGEALSPVEKQIAQKSMALVDSMQSESAMAEDIWNEDEEITHQGSNIKEMRDLEEWFNRFNPFVFLKENPGDVHIHINDEKHNLDESDNSGAFETQIEHPEDQEVDVTVYYDIEPYEPMTREHPGSQASVDVYSVVLKNSGQDIFKELNPKQLDQLQDEAFDHYNDQGAADQDRADDDRFQRMRDEPEDDYDYGEQDESILPVDDGLMIDEFDQDFSGTELDEISGNTFTDPSEPSSGYRQEPDSYHGSEKAEKAMEFAKDNFNLKEFFEKYGSDFDWDEREGNDPTDMNYESSYVISSIAHYLERLANDRNEDNIYFDDKEFMPDAEELFSTAVKPAMEKEGFTFDGASMSSSDVPTESIDEEDGDDSEKQKLEAAIQKLDSKMKFVESNPDKIDFDMIYKNGQHFIYEKNTKTIVGSASSGGAAMSVKDSWNSNKDRSVDKLMIKLQEHVDNLQYELRKMSGDSDTEYEESAMPPARNIVPRDAPHSFMNDIQDHSITSSNSGDALARLKKLAGI